MASYRLAVRRDTAANWTSADPILAQGEFGYESDTSLLKIGDGVTAWTGLGYYDPNPALGTGGSLVGAFKYKDTAGDPGAGRFGFDNVNPASITLLNISVVSLNDFAWVDGPFPFTSQNRGSTRRCFVAFGIGKIAKRTVNRTQAIGTCGDHQA